MSATEHTPLLHSLDQESLDFAVNRDRAQDRENGKAWRHLLFPALATCAIGSILLSILFITSASNNPLLPHWTADELGAAWGSHAEPFSRVDPASLGFIAVQRPYESMPGPAFGALLNNSLPLPTNSWYENFLLGRGSEESSVFQVPYILDTAGRLDGIRTHPCHVQANARTIMMTFEASNGVSLGAVEPLNPQYVVHSQGKPVFTKLALELEWIPANYALDHYTPTSSVPYKMRAPIVRGSPYMSMLYFNATPKMSVERSLHGTIKVDEGVNEIDCGIDGNFSEPFLVQREMKLTFYVSDMTWLIFLSEPMEFTCSNYDAVNMTKGVSFTPGVVDPRQVSIFTMQAVAPKKLSMLRLAMSNNCTFGENTQYCGPERKPHDQRAFETLLRNHAQAYPTAQADIEFTFPVDSAEEEELRVIFNWQPNYMYNIARGRLDMPTADIRRTINSEQAEVLMFALPHHQERMRRTVASSNLVMSVACMPTIHGNACPAIGNSWSLVEHLHPVSFHAPRLPRQEMQPAIIKALRQDLLWKLPANYRLGAGDTYFSGKLLARMARTLIIADEMGLQVSDLFKPALDRLREGVEVWLNGSAESMFLYDRSWGGVVMCGCDYSWNNVSGGHCQNKFPECPALTDMGSNFGAGFYNDHHYHFGYHIYAAAVVSKYDHLWARRYNEHVLLLLRDIANPSEDDIYFPTWRHKDWYLGFSWASGVVTHNGQPYLNGRNQESVSEAISAYEAVALYGDVMSQIYDGRANLDEGVKQQSFLRTREMGRLLMATEIRSAKTYWHVLPAGTPNVSRIYPDIYQSKVVGMIWSMLAQEQTWFGNEVWKSYGIQLLPITPVAELRDDPAWVRAMLPVYAKACLSDPVCVREGWSIVVFTSLATIGLWREAWAGIEALDPVVFESAGGNGHSLSNALWYVATRPEVGGNLSVAQFIDRVNDLIPMN